MQYLYLFLLLLLVTSCNNKSKSTAQPNIPTLETTYSTYGKTIMAADAVSGKSMANHYAVMAQGDSIPAKIKATVTNVCKAKGCWMTLDINGDKNVMVKFKDYGFFVPTDITGKTVIVNGKAFVTEVSVNELRHYAKDAGKTDTEIATITVPERTYAFEADGVLVDQ